MRERLQLFTMAFIFLLLLYNSPSALVIYWTCNNIFSLLKNIVYKLKIKRPAVIVYSIIMLGLTAVLFYVLYFRSRSQGRSKQATIAVYFLMASMPFFVKLVNLMGARYFSGLTENIKQIRNSFLLVSFTLFVLCGIVIPFNLVASDPATFSFLDKNLSPFSILRLPIFTSFGVFVFGRFIFFYRPQKKLSYCFSF
jgi:hypothetical protein